MSNEKNELEQEFENTYNKVKDEIEGKLTHARKYIREAVNLAEKHKIPFSTSVSEIHNSYVPRSFTNSKFSELEPDFVEDLTGVYNVEDYGWSHSAVC